MRKLRRAYQQSYQRCLYESYNGARVSDSFWSKLTRACRVANVPLDSESVRLLFELRKVSSHLVSNVLMIKDYFPPKVAATPTTGKAIYARVSELGISPNLSTFYRWFYRLGLEFKSNTLYDPNTVALVLLQAYIYKFKQRRLNNAR